MLDDLEAFGVDYDDVVPREREGIEKLVASLNELLNGIVARRDSLRAA